MTDMDVLNTANNLPTTNFTNTLSAFLKNHRLTIPTTTIPNNNNNGLNQTQQQQQQIQLQMNQQNTSDNLTAQSLKMILDSTTTNPSSATTTTFDINSMLNNAAAAAVAAAGVVVNSSPTKGPTNNKRLKSSPSSGSNTPTNTAGLNPGVSTTKSGTKKSFVWKYFRHPISDGGIVDRSRTQCLLCDSQLAFNASGTTTTMLNHLKSRHGEIAETEENIRRVNRSFNQQQQQQQQQTTGLVEDSLMTPNSTTTTTTTGGGGGGGAKGKFSQAHNVKASRQSKNQHRNSMETHQHNEMTFLKMNNNNNNTSSVSHHNLLPTTNNLFNTLSRTFPNINNIPSTNSSSSNSLFTEMKAAAAAINHQDFGLSSLMNNNPLLTHNNNNNNNNNNGINCFDPNFLQTWLANMTSSRCGDDVNLKVVDNNHSGILNPFLGGGGGGGGLTGGCKESSPQPQVVGPIPNSPTTTTTSSSSLLNANFLMSLINFLPAHQQLLQQQQQQQNNNSLLQQLNPMLTTSGHPLSTPTLTTTTTTTGCRDVDDDDVVDNEGNGDDNLVDDDDDDDEADDGGVEDGGRVMDEGDDHSNVYDRKAKRKLLMNQTTNTTAAASLKKRKKNLVATAYSEIYKKSLDHIGRTTTSPPSTTTTTATTTTPKMKSADKKMTDQDSLHHNLTYFLVKDLNSVDIIEGVGFKRLWNFGGYLPTAIKLRNKYMQDLESSTRLKLLQRLANIERQPHQQNQLFCVNLLVDVWSLESGQTFFSVGFSFNFKEDVHHRHRHHHHDVDEDEAGSPTNDSAMNQEFLWKTQSINPTELMQVNEFINSCLREINIDRMRQEIIVVTTNRHRLLLDVFKAGEENNNNNKKKKSTTPAYKFIVMPCLISLFDETVNETMETLKLSNFYTTIQRNVQKANRVNLRRERRSSQLSGDSENSSSVQSVDSNMELLQDGNNNSSSSGLMIRADHSVDSVILSNHSSFNIINNIENNVSSSNSNSKGTAQMEATSNSGDLIRMIKNFDEIRRHLLSPASRGESMASLLNYIIKKLSNGDMEPTSQDAISPKIYEVITNKILDQYKLSNETTLLIDQMFLMDERIKSSLFPCNRNSTIKSLLGMISDERMLSGYLMSSSHDGVIQTPTEIIELTRKFRILASPFCCIPVTDDEHHSSSSTTTTNNCQDYSDYDNFLRKRRRLDPKDVDIYTFLNKNWN